MQGRRRLGVCGLVLTLALVAACAAPALGALPRTYQVQRIDGPQHQGSTLNRGGDRFGDGFVNVGDVSGDGRDDLLVGISQRGAITGKVFLISGADGSLIRAIPPPDADPGGSGDHPAAFGAYVGRYSDFATCLGGNPGENCTGAQIGLPDGVPEQVVSGPGVDVLTAGVTTEGNDMGFTYVLDGRTGTVLMRLRMPLADRQTQALNAPGASQGPGFGRALLTPAGQPPCAGFGGVGNCDNPANSAVALGDLDGDGAPEVVVGAPEFSETSSSNSTCTATCREAGRIYIFTGQQLLLAESSSDLLEPAITIKNPILQDDGVADPASRLPEWFGASLTPIGDVGSCEPPTPGTPIFCLNDPSGSASNVRDNVPDFAVSAPRLDVGQTPEAGSAFVIDGKTLRVINVLSPAQLQQPTEQGIQFSFANYNQPALGDVSGDSTPDIYFGAIYQDVAFNGQGRGYVLNGRPVVGSDLLSLATLDDTTPAKFGNFGTSSAGIGDVALNSLKELMVGAYGGPDAPSGFENVTQIIGDVHIFSPITDVALQTITDPDRQPDSGFGRNLAPMGDLNGDGFLDYAVGAGGFDGTAANQGRIYLLRSDNPSAAAAPSGGSGAPAASGGPPASVRAGRTIDLSASRKRVSRGGRVRLAGSVKALANRGACERSQRIEIQRRSRGKGYRTFMRAKTARNGKFAGRTRPRRTYLYRALVQQTSQCLGAVSKREKVTVRPKTSKRSRR